MPVLAGSIGLIHLIGQPRFETIGAVSVVQLIGSGLCFGIALTAVLAILRSKRDD